RPSEGKKEIPVLEALTGRNHYLMAQPNLEQLLEAGVHFGHQTRRWNPKMRRFIFAERNGIHIIDLQKTLRQLELAQKLIREVVSRGENVLFVCTKRQLAAIVMAEAERAGSYYVTERWLGGLLTNFSTVKKQAKKLGIPVVAIVDTNADPDLISVPIAGNDDAIRSVELIAHAIADTIAEARMAAPQRQDEDESESYTYSSDRGTEPASGGDRGN